MRKKLPLLITCSLIVTLLGGCGGFAARDTSKDNGTGFEINTGAAAPAAEAAVADNYDYDYAAEESYAVSYTDGLDMDSSTYYEEDEDVYYEGEDFNTEEYNTIKEYGFEYVSSKPLSTFAADVDTGSYCNLRRMLNDYYDMDSIPSGAVRTEEMINYFDYPLMEKNKTDGKFSLQYTVNNCPWNEDNQLLVMTITANDNKVKSAGNNFVYLIDSSGSMYSSDKLDLAIEGFKNLTKALDENDLVSIVTYAGDSDTLVEGCPAGNYKKIFKALESIQANGGTNGSGGIEAAYDCALRNYIKNGNNRVIIASDGDMNLGVTSQSGLVDLIKEKKESGVFLTTLGFGTGNYSDANMEQIADAGNGNYYYIDSLKEAKRVLVDKLMQTTVTVAKDVKFQAEFNPNVVSEYRLIGYENRKLSAKDFDDDTKDGGEVGAGQQVTVVYELVPANGENGGKELKYQKSESTNDSDDILTLSIRYKHPKKDNSELEEYAVTKKGNGNKEDWYFVAGLTEFSLILHKSDYKGQATLKDAIKLLNTGKTHDEYRQECFDLIKSLESDYEDPYYEDDDDFNTFDEDEQGTIDRDTVDLFED